MADAIDGPDAESSDPMLGSRKLRVFYVAAGALVVGMLSSLAALVVSSASASMVGTVFLPYVGGIGTLAGLYMNANVKSKALDAGVAKVP